MRATRLCAVIALTAGVGSHGHAQSTVVADHGDISRGLSRPLEPTFTVKLGNIELLKDECVDSPFVNNYGHSWRKFNRQHRAHFIYVWRVFRAKGTTADLTVSDWKSDAEPGGPIGQELMFSFVEVQPYLSAP